MMPLPVLAKEDDIETSADTSKNEKTEVEWENFYFGDNVKYEILSDGKIKATIPYDTVFNEEKGVWEEADCSLRVDEKNNEYKPSKTQYNALFRTNSTSSKGTFLFETEEEWIECDLFRGRMAYGETGKKSEAKSYDPTEYSIETAEKQIEYNEIFKDTDVKYTLLPFGVKEDIILNAPPKCEESENNTALFYEWDLSISEGLTIWANGIDQTGTDFRTQGNIEFIKDGETAFWFGAPFAYDSSENIDYWVDCVYDVKKVGDKLSIAIEIPFNWLLNESRIYPITIDPTTFSAYPSDDTFVSCKSPDFNYGSATVVYTRNDDGGSTGWAYDPVVKFDLSSIPSGSTVDSAYLYLYYYDWKDTNPAGRTINCRKLLSNWNEGTITWNNQPSHSSTVSASSTIPSSFSWMYWSLKNDVQNFVNGQSNYGWRLSDENTWGGSNIPIAYYHSKEYGSSRPQITVEYTPAGDAYEPDNSFSEYSTMTVYQSLSTQSRSIYPAGDNDYIQFYAYGGREYRFYSTGNTDTYGYLYDSNHNELTHDDDSGESLNIISEREISDL